MTLLKLSLKPFQNHAMTTVSDDGDIIDDKYSHDVGCGGVESGECSACMNQSAVDHKRFKVVGISIDYQRDKIGFLSDEISSKMPLQAEKVFVLDYCVIMMKVAGAFGILLC